MIGRVCLLALMLTSSLAATPGAFEYQSDRGASTLGFAFTQAGARSQGRFQDFDARMTYQASAARIDALHVTIRVASIDTQDKERDQLLRGADLFDAARLPLATFKATHVVRQASGSYLASGVLRIRDVARTVSIAFELTRDLRMRGRFSLHRLDFGVGQGEWRSTEWVADEVVVDFSLVFKRA